MNLVLSFEAPVVPEGKARARATTIGGFARMYTPKKTVKYEQMIGRYALEAMSRERLQTLSGALRVEIEAHFPLPASKARKRAPVAAAPHVSKPDADNVAKAVMDSMNGLVWGDDASVSELEVKKLTLAQGEPARLGVKVYTLTLDAAPISSITG